MLVKIRVKVKTKHNSSVLSLIYLCGILIITFDLRLRNQFILFMMMFSIPYDSIYFLFANITFSLLEMRVEIKIDRAAIVLLIVFSFNILIITFSTKLQSNTCWSHCKEDSISISFNILLSLNYVSKPTRITLKVNICTQNFNSTETSSYWRRCSSTDTVGRDGPLLTLSAEMHLHFYVGEVPALSRKSFLLSKHISHRH